MRHCGSTPAFFMSCKSAKTFIDYGDGAVRGHGDTAGNLGVETALLRHSRNLDVPPLEKMPGSCALPNVKILKGTSTGRFVGTYRV
jgi:hypothetical protein